MKSFLVILAWHLLLLLLLLLIVTEKGCFAAKTTNCQKPSDFLHDENCQCDVDKVCIRKCCPENQVLKKMYKTKCIDGHYRKNFWEDRWDGNRTDIRVLNSPGTHLVVGFPGDNVVFTEKDENFTVNSKGELLVQNNRSSTFCLDYVNASGMVLAAMYVGKSTPNVDQKPPKILRQVNYTLLNVSILFLLITFFVYALESKLRTLQGKCLMCYLLCAISYSSILGLIRREMLKTNATICRSAGYLTLYSALAGFFWLNIMCIDLSLALKRLVHRTGNIKDFLLYSLYAWGSPLVVVCIAMLAQFTDILGLQVKPNFGKNFCWFMEVIDEEAHKWYFCYIVIPLLIVNVVLFIHTVRIIQTRNGQKKHLERNDSQRNTENEKRRFFLFMKLSIMMGLNWIGEFLPLYIKEIPEELVFVIGIPNVLQGFFIFVIFVCKRRVLALLNQRFYPSKIFIHERKPRKSSTQTLMSTASTVRSPRTSSTRAPSFS